MSRGSRCVPPAPGMRPSCTSGKREHGLGMIARDAIAARERGLESAAETRAVNRGDDGNPQRFEPREQRLAAAAQRFRVGGGLQREKLVDVGAGEPGVALAAREHDSTYPAVRLELCEHRGELGAQAGRDLVHRLARQVDRDDGDAVRRAGV